jgi:hypothetical protein
VNGLAGGLAGVAGPAAPWLGRLRGGITRRRPTRGVHRLVRNVLADVVQEPTAQEHWELHRGTWTDTGVAVVPAGPVGRSPTVVVKLTLAEPVVPSLRRHVAVLRQLSAEPGLADWSPLPRPVHAGPVGDQGFAVVESALPGRPAHPVARTGAPRRQLVDAALDAIAVLHARTRREVTLDDRMLAGWVDRPVQALSGALRRRGATAEVHRLEDLGAELGDTLRGQRAGVGWVHGDFWLGNVLVGPDGRVTGIVDWDLAQPEELGLHDVWHLLLYGRRLTSRRELGAVVADVLRESAWSPQDQETLDRARAAAWPTLSVRTAGILYWLRHVGALAPLPDHGGNTMWVRHNVQAVIRTL